MRGYGSVEEYEGQEIVGSRHNCKVKDIQDSATITSYVVELGRRSYQTATESSKSVYQDGTAARLQGVHFDGRFRHHVDSRSQQRCACSSYRLIVYCSKAQHGVANRDGRGVFRPSINVITSGTQPLEPTTIYVGI